MEKDKKTKISIQELILSANVALLGEIRPNMRRIYVDYNNEENKIILYFFYDTPPTEDDLDYDVEGGIAAEMSCQFSDDTDWETKSFVIPYPQIIVKPSDICVYSRYELPPKD